MPGRMLEISIVWRIEQAPLRPGRAYPHRTPRKAEVYCSEAFSGKRHSAEDLLRSRVFGPSLLQDGNVGVGVLP